MYLQAKPLCSPEEIPSLVDENGEFYSSKVINKRKEDTINIEECEKEIEAQLNHFIEITGFKPHYFEGHAVFSFNYMKALENVAKRHGLFFVNPMDPQWVSENHIHGLGMIHFDERGLYDPKRYMEDNLGMLKDNECCIAIFHPGYLDQYILTNSSYTLIRPMECDFLCSDWLKDWIKQNDIQLVTLQ